MGEGAEQPPDIGMANRALGVMLTLQAMAAILFMTVAVLAPALPQGLGLDEDGIGFFAAATFLGAMFGSPLAALLIRRTGAVRLTQCGIMLSAAGLAALLTGNPWIALAGALVIGVGYGPNAPGGSHLLARYTPSRRRSLYFSIKQSGVPVGGALAGLLLPAIEAALGWQAALWTVFGLAALAVMAVQPWRRRLDPERLDPPRPLHLRVGRILPLEALKAHPGLPLISFTGFVYGGGQMIMFAYMVIYLTTEAGLNLTHAGYAYAAMQGASMVMRILAGWLNDRWGRPRALLAGFGLAAAAGVGLLAGVDAGTGFPALLAIAALCGAAAAGWNGVYLSEVARIVPQADIASATAATVFCTYFGLVAGPAMFGVAVAWGGYHAGFAGLALMVLIGAGASLARSGGARSH